MAFETSSGLRTEGCAVPTTVSVEDAKVTLRFHIGNAWLCRVRYVRGMRVHSAHRVYSIKDVVRCMVHNAVIAACILIQISCHHVFVLHLGARTLQRRVAHLEDTLAKSDQA